MRLDYPLRCLMGFPGSEPGSLESTIVIDVQDVQWAAGLGYQFVASDPEDEAAVIRYWQSLGGLPLLKTS